VLNQVRATKPQSLTAAAGCRRGPRCGAAGPLPGRLRAGLVPEAGGGGGGGAGFAGGGAGGAPPVAGGVAAYGTRRERLGERETARVCQTPCEGVSGRLGSAMMAEGMVWPGSAPPGWTSRCTRRKVRTLSRCQVSLQGTSVGASRGIGDA
jgi:hypothetical protein